MASSTTKPSPADIITNAIITRLEAGVKPWIKPWRPGAGGRPLRVTGQPYRGINCFWLWMVAENRGYNARSWMTYRQAQALGGQVREGERAEIAVFYKSYTKKIVSPVTGDPGDELRRVLRAYSVFNADQISGLPDHFYPPLLAAVPPADQLPQRASQFIDALPAKVHHRGCQAYYDPMADAITMPPVQLFESRAAWAATLAHEAGHWSGAPHRLDRQFGKKFGDMAYSFEELVAELTACLLGADLGLPSEHIDNHAAYIGHWLAILKKDSRAILSAAAKAEAAAGYLLRAAGLTDHAEERQAGTAEAA